MDVTALVLAAGSSKRMGSPKALLEWRAETFVARICRVLLEGGATRVRVVVGGPHRPEIEDAVGGLPGAVQVVVNLDPSEGPISSVRIGIAATPTTGAYLIHPVDIPAIEPEDVATLIAAAERDPTADAVVPSIAMRRGHPLLLSAACAQRLLAPDAPATVRELLRAEGVQILHVVRENRGLLRDIDTPEDLG